MSNSTVRVHTQGSLTRKKRQNEAKKVDSKRKSDAISTARRLFLRQNAFCETHNYGLGRGNNIGKSGKEKNRGDEWVWVVERIGGEMSCVLLRFCVLRKGCSLG